MPTYRARSVAIQLSTAPLHQTTTRNPIKGQTVQASSNVEIVNNVFSKATITDTLGEARLLDEDCGSELLFLGEGKDMPYMMVHAGRETATRGRTRTQKGVGDRERKRPSRTTATLETVELVDQKRESFPASQAFEAKSAVERYGPSSSKNAPRRRRTFEGPSDYLQEIQRAICLNVYLDTSTFNKRYSSSDRRATDMLDLQIIVYLNGSLASTYFISQRMAMGNPSPSKLTFRLTGSRLLRMIEKPWVIDPPQVPDLFTLPGPDRWNAISEALKQEAVLTGKDSKGNRPPTGQLLESLCTLKCPADVKMMKHFGCMDVIVVSGKGKKAASSNLYNTRPVRMNDNAFRVEEHLNDTTNRPYNRSSTSPRRLPTSPGRQTDSSSVTSSFELASGVNPSAPRPILQDVLENTSRPAISHVPYLIKVLQERLPEATQFQMAQGSADFQMPIDETMSSMTELTDLSNVFNTPQRLSATPRRRDGPSTRLSRPNDDAKSVIEPFKRASLYAKGSTPTRSTRPTPQARTPALQTSPMSPLSSIKSDEVVTPSPFLRGDNTSQQEGSRGRPKIMLRLRAQNRADHIGNAADSPPSSPTSSSIKESIQPTALTSSMSLEPRRRSIRRSTSQYSEYKRSKPNEGGANSEASNASSSSSSHNPKEKDKGKAKASGDERRQSAATELSDNSKRQSTTTESSTTSQPRVPQGVVGGKRYLPSHTRLLPPTPAKSQNTLPPLPPPPPPRPAGLRPPGVGLTVPVLDSSTSTSPSPSEHMSGSLFSSSRRGSEVNVGISGFSGIIAGVGGAFASNNAGDEEENSSTPFDANFSRPALSEGSVLGFAPPGVVRNVSAQKNGWFKEEEVVFGGRFIVS